MLSLNVRTPVHENNHTSHRVQDPSLTRISQQTESVFYNTVGLPFVDSATQFWDSASRNLSTFCWYSRQLCHLNRNYAT